MLGLTDENGVETVKAVIVPTGGLQRKDIAEFCRDRIAEFKVPRIVEFRDELPRSPTGKVLREQLK